MVDVDDLGSYRGCGGIHGRMDMQNGYMEAKSMTTLYVKRGRRYHPVGEYSPEAIDMLPYGTHMICAFPGHKIFRYQVNPDHAGILAALQTHKDKILADIVAASEIKLSGGNRPVSKKEQKAIAAYRAIMGDTLMILSRPAAHDIVDALERALIGETS